MDLNVDAASRRLAYVLRHAPQAVGLHLDAAGWVDVTALLDALASDEVELTRADLEAIVTTSDKQRFELDGDRVRARQGHSVRVDLGLAPQSPPAQLFHGTADRFLASIETSGLVRGARHHVHLSPDAVTAENVGARHGRPVVMVVDAAAMARDGYVFFVTSNGVWLTDTVPPQYLTRA